MFFPLNDDNPLRVIRTQYVTAIVIFLNIAIFMWTGSSAGEQALMLTSTQFGVVPSELLDLRRVGLPGLNPVGEPFTLITYMFLHGSWIHVLGNMLFLWVFADNVEDAFGHLGFILFYLITGIAAAGFHVVMNAGSHDPLIGASGAVSGVLASYLLLFPKARVLVLVFLILPLRVPAWLVLGSWFGLQVFHLFDAHAQGEAVAWWAHIGGFASGAVLTLALRSRLQFKT